MRGWFSLGLALVIVGGVAPSAFPQAEVDCAAPRCEARISAGCLNRIGAGSLTAGDACAAEQAGYVACLTAVAERCGQARRPQAGERCAPEDARQLYAELQGGRDAAALELFAKTCAGTPQAGLASMRAERLRAAEGAARQQAMRGLGQFTGQWVSAGFPIKGCPTQLLISAESGLLRATGEIDDRLERLGFTKRVEYRVFQMSKDRSLIFEGEPLAMTGVAYKTETGAICAYRRP